MEFEPQNGTKLLMLMIAGAVFAGAGLYLMLRPKPEGSSAKIEIFGLKFESSSAGLLVFLIGSVFLSIPLFVPEKRLAPQDLAGNGRNLQSPPPSPLPILPRQATVEEIEPNEIVQDANQLSMDATVSGSVRRGDFDWFVVSTEGQEGMILAATVRHVSGGGVYAEVFNHEEQKQRASSTFTGANVMRMEITGPRAFLRTQPTGSNTAAKYELVIRVEQP